MHTEITSVQKTREVSALLSVPDSRIIAGGTTFSPQNSEGLHLVDISGLEGLNGIRQKGNRIEIGPLASLESIAGSMLIKAHLPSLAECTGSAANAEIRQRGTIGGNIASKRIGDTAPVLLAAGAKLTIKTDSDFREILIDRFWNADGENDLDYDEWITRITVSVPRDEIWGAAFGKIGEWDCSRDPVACAAVQLSLNEENTITAVRGAWRLGSNNIRRMFPLEKSLKNHPAADETIERAVQSMTASAQEFMSRADCTAFLREILQRSISMAEERRSL